MDKQKVNTKESFMITMLKEELRKRDEENKKLKNELDDIKTMKEYDYINKVVQHYEGIIKVLTSEIKEVNEANVNIKKEADWHNERVKFYKNRNS